MAGLAIALILTLIGLVITTEGRSYPMDRIILNVRTPGDAAVQSFHFALAYDQSQSQSIVHNPGKAQWRTHPSYMQTTKNQFYAFVPYTVEHGVFGSRRLDYPQFVVLQIELESGVYYKEIALTGLPSKEVTVEITP